MSDPIVVRGTVIVHRESGARHVIETRKRDGTGWWLTDGSGIADTVLRSGTWDITDEHAEILVRRRCQHCDHIVDAPGA